MILCDTSFWIAYLRNAGTARSDLDLQIEADNVGILECIVGELLQGAREDWEQDMIREVWDFLPHLDRPGLWLDAGNLSRREKFYAQGLSLIDTVILVAALSSGAELWTLDRKLAAAWKAARR